MENETIRHRLVAERLAVRRLAHVQRQVLAESLDADVIDAEVAATVLRMAEEREAAVLDALVRLQEGTYGRCETCGEPIAADRLLAVPSARFCDADEQDWELHRLLVLAPDLPPALGVAPEPGWWELAGMADPDDDESLTPAPEEAALHDEEAGDTIDPDRFEAAEAALEAEQAAGDDARAEADRAEVAALEDAALEEQELTGR